MHSGTNSLAKYLSPQAYAEMQTAKLLSDARAQRRAARQSEIKPLDLDLDWRTFLKKHFPHHTSAGFAAHHVALWDWVWRLVKGVRPAPFVAIWARGGAKSSSAEMAAAAVVMRQTRRYVLYLSATQDLADKHVATIAALLEEAGIERAVNKYGSSKGWRRNRLRAANGTTIDALGLDTAARGIKVEQDRPDMMVIDDIDERHDSPAQTQKKIDTLTNTILPAGATDNAVLAVQNVVHANSIFARLADGRADFLSDRTVSGPIPAVNELVIEMRNGEAVIVSGTPTWDGQTLAVCQGQVRTWGLRSFLREAQHEVKDSDGALWKRETLDATRVAHVSQLTRIAVAVDPSGNKGTGNECGIIAGGVGLCNCKGKPELHAFVLADDSLLDAPNAWAKRAAGAYNRLGAHIMVAEGNYGGAMVESTIKTADPHVNVKIITASHGKQARAEPISSLYGEGKVHHVGHFTTLENELCTWEPNTGAPSPNRLDALVWLVTELLLKPAVALTQSGNENATERNRWNVGGGREEGGSRWHL